jgi:hypothetical protein
MEETRYTREALSGVSPIQNSNTYSRRNSANPEKCEEQRRALGGTSVADTRKTRCAKRQYSDWFDT